MVSGMLVLAHRGANRLEPENTVPAMQEAIDRGADGVELDVHRTADGVLVVRHDAETPVGPLGELTAADLGRALPEVPTLAVVLDVCRGRLVNVEIKDPDPRAAEAVVDLHRRPVVGPVVRGPMTCSCRRSTWRPSTGSGRSHPTSRPGSCRSGSIPTHALTIAVEHGHTAVHPDVWTLATGRRRCLRVPRPRPRPAGQRLDRERPRAARAALRDAGVDAVITDDTDLYRFGERGGGVRGR